MHLAPATISTISCRYGLNFSCRRCISAHAFARKLEIAGRIFISSSLWRRKSSTMVAAVFQDIYTHFYVLSLHSS